MFNYQEVLDPAFVARVAERFDGIGEAGNNLPALVVLRTNQWKASWQKFLFQDLTQNVTVLESDWIEPDHGNTFVMPVVTAAQKAIDRSDILNKNMVDFSTDTTVVSEIGPVNKPPKDSTKSEIFESLTLLIGGNGQEKQFEVSCGMALFGPDSTGTSVGISSTERHRFVFSGLTEQVIADYVDSLTLDELKQTNGAVRWPHDLIQSNIMDINGVPRGHDRFEERLTLMFLALIGAPLSGRRLFHEFSKHSTVIGEPDRINGSFFGHNLPGDWSYAMELKTKELAICRWVEPADCEAISAMMNHNFNLAPSYQDLSPDAKRLY